MKALNIHQPWAELIIQGRKTIELRTRRTTHRGLLAIRATKTVVEAFCRQVDLDPATLVTGAILGTVELVEVIEMTPDRFHSLRAEHLSGGIAPGRRKWGWRLTNSRRLAKPIVCSALPGMFTLPEEIAVQIRGQQ
jgi:hypothetical protein